MSLFQRRVPVILQSEAPECGIACLAMVASFHGHRTDLSAMRVRLSPSLKGVTLKHIAQIAESMGLSARGVQVPLESLAKLRLPAVLGIAFATLIVISVAVTAVRAWVGVYLSTNINLKLLSTLFTHMLRLPLAWFEKRNIGDIVSKFRSVDAIQRTLSTTFVETAI